MCLGAISLLDEETEFDVLTQAQSDGWVYEGRLPPVPFLLGLRRPVTSSSDLTPPMPPWKF